MKTIIAADIHGVTQELRSALSFLGKDAIFLSPWATDACPYENEQQAVSEFLASGGIDQYTAKIAAAIGNEAVLLVGFSVGATCAWIVVANANCHPQSQAILYYGSRIRDYHALAPRCEVSLVFAEHEISFNPANLVAAIKHANVTSQIVEGTSHGFMNPRSGNFAAQQAQDQLKLLTARFSLSPLIDR